VLRLHFLSQPWHAALFIQATMCESVCGRCRVMHCHAGCANMDALSDFHTLNLRWCCTTASSYSTLACGSFQSGSYVGTAGGAAWDVALLVGCAFD
jgi:hypothetical protein